MRLPVLKTLSVPLTVLQTSRAGTAGFRKCEIEGIDVKHFGQRKLMLMGIDILALCLSCLLAYFVIRFSSQITLATNVMLWNSIAFIVCNTLSLILWGTYNKVWRYAGMWDLLCCVFSTLSGT